MASTKNSLFLIFLSLVIGCAGNPVPVELPQNHPADPGASEFRFIPPPDPFGTEMTSAVPQTQEPSESEAGRRKSRGDLFESPAIQSVPLEQEKKETDRSPLEMPHHHDMEMGQ